MNVTPRPKQGVLRSPSMLKASRRAVIERSGGACEARIGGVCAGQGSAAHHVHRRSQGGSDLPENLRWLCPPCHEWVHGHPTLAADRGLLSRPSGGLLAVYPATRLYDQDAE